MRRDRVWLDGGGRWSNGAGGEEKEKKKEEKKRKERKRNRWNDVFGVDVECASVVELFPVNQKDNKKRDLID